MTLLGSASESAITFSKDFVASSSRLEIACGCRSKLLGVITTSGLRILRMTCRRSAWNSCAGVVRFITMMLSSAASVRKRSRRAELCSGP